MMYSSIVISNEAVKRCEGGELWFPCRDVVGRKPRIAGIVNLIDKRKRFVGMAFLSPGSRYYIRVFSRAPAKADKEFWRERIRRAYERRVPLAATTDAYRVVHAEADGIPSVVIDKYNDIWSLQTTSSGAETIKKDLIEIVVADYSPASVIEKNASQMRKAEGLPTGDRIAFGSRRSATIKEGDQSFEVDVLAGQKTGAYLDYRSFRLKAREFARGRCLDAFCYQGWFSCQIAGAANEVIAIDSSAAAVEAAKKNAAINRHGNIEFVKADVLEFFKGQGEPFDFIHLDPPAFAKGGAKTEAAVRGYRRIVEDALRLLAPHGTLMVSSCSHGITEGVLEKIVAGCLQKAGLACEVIYRGIQDRDHPPLKGHPESLYLKAVAVSV
ncbi:MAG: class I SAM-dependent rRNA methyltransferase [Pseudomonadota bacterium]